MATFGFLAIWTEIEEQHFIEYRRWLTREHIGQRIFASGFLGARVHARVDNERAHFILYAAQSENVLQSAPYLQVLNHPTPWTQRMMPRLRHFDRGAGHQVAKVGDGTGAWLVVCRVAIALKDGSAVHAEEVLKGALEIEGVVTARLFTVDDESTAIPTTEKAMRSGSEGAFRSLLVIETSSEAAASQAEALTASLVESVVGSAAEHDVARFRFVYALHAFERATTVVA